MRFDLITFPRRDDHVERLGPVESLQNCLREVFGFVCTKCQLPLSAQRQALKCPGHQAIVIDRVPQIIRLKVPEKLLDIDGLSFLTQHAPEKCSGAAPDMAGNLGNRKFFAAGGRKRKVARSGDVPPRIDEGTIQIKDERARWFHGPGV